MTRAQTIDEAVRRVFRRNSAWRDVAKSSFSFGNPYGSAMIKLTEVIREEFRHLNKTGSASI